MADSIALPQTRPVSLPGRLYSLLPGVILLAAVGFAGKFIEQFIARYGKAHHVVLPNIEMCLGHPDRGWDFQDHRPPCCVSRRHRDL